MKTPYLVTFATVVLSAGAVQAATMVNFEFNSVGDTEGWTASTAPANAVVTGFTATTGIDGTTGVATSADVDIDPQVTRGTPITLSVGETWASMEVRFRQLDGNPGDGGVGPISYDPNGTILFFNGNTQNFGVGPVTTTVNNGAGAFAGDVYSMTLTPEGSGEWQVMSLDLSAAPVLNSGDITAVRFDPVGNAATKNFEIDYIRFASVPEPGSLAFVLLGGLGLLIRRR